MNIIQSIKCSLTTKMSIEEYYASLTLSQLKDRQKNLYKQFLYPAIIWICTSITILVTARMDLELVILFSIASIGVNISLYADYAKRRKLLSQYINELKEQDD